MTEIKGELLHLNQQDFNFRIIELQGIVRDAYKIMVDIYGVTYANMQRINKLDLYVKILFETLLKYEDFKELKRKIEKLEKETKILSDDRIKWALKEFHQMISKTDKEFEGKKID